MRDGVIIVNTALTLFRDYKPLTFFGVAGLLLVAASLALTAMVAAGLVAPDRISYAALVVTAGALAFCGLLSVSVGLVLHSIARRSQEFEHHVRMLLDELVDARVARDVRAEKKDD
jgi:hypothetical protein